MNDERIGEIHICTSCLVAHEVPDALTDEDRALNPLNRIEEEQRITADYDSETGEGYREFSWSRCDGCGSTLGGSRYRFVLWGPAEEDEPLYQVLKFFEREGKAPEVIAEDLTLREAKLLCNAPDTSGGEEGNRWFYGFRKQD